MAILFDWYENPVSPDQPKKKRFHPRIAYNGQVDTDEMRSKIQSRCTLNEVDVTAVLDALSQVMGEARAAPYFYGSAHRPIFEIPPRLYYTQEGLTPWKKN